MSRLSARISRAQSSRSRYALLAAAACSLAATAVQAQVTNYATWANPVTADWNTAGAWTPSAPVDTTWQAIIANGGTAVINNSTVGIGQLSLGAASAAADTSLSTGNLIINGSTSALSTTGYDIQIGNGGGAGGAVGTLTQNDGTVSTNKNIQIGLGAAGATNASGTYVLNGGNITASGQFNVGNNGVGTFIENNAASTVNVQTGTVGVGAGSGYFALKNGSFSTAASQDWNFRNGAGVMNGGTFNASQQFNVGRGGTATFVLTGGTINSVFNSSSSYQTGVIIGSYDGSATSSAGTFDQYGGTVNSKYYVSLCYQNPSASAPLNATYNMYDGTVQSSRGVYAGGGYNYASGSKGNFVNGNAVFNQYHGTVTSTGDVGTVGYNPNTSSTFDASRATGTYNMEGGLLTSTATTSSSPNLSIGFAPSGTATFNMDGGLVLNPLGNLVMGSRYSQSYLNLRGGQLVTNKVYIGSAGLANYTGVHISWTGGTLTANNVNLVFVNDGGVLSPGIDSVNGKYGSGAIGTMAIGTAAYYVQHSTGLYAVDLGSGGASDRLTTSSSGAGNIDLAGGLVTSTLPGATINPGDIFTVATASTSLVDNGIAVCDVSPLPVTFTKDSSDGVNLKLTAVAADQWNNDSAASIADGASWLNGTPNASGVKAHFGPSGANAARTVNVDSAVTFGTINLDNASGYTLANSGGSITMDMPAVSAAAALNSLSGNNVVAAPVSLGKVLNVNVSSGSSVALNGVISDSAALAAGSKTGLVTAGTVSLGAANTYSGATTINSGTLTTTVASAIPSASAVTVAAGATLDMAGNAQTVGSLAGDGNVINNAALTLASDASTRFYGTVSGSGSLEKQGTGNLTLAGSNTYTGGTTITAGTITTTTANLPAGGAIANNANLTFDQNFDGTYTGPIAGSGNLTKTGYGDLTVSAASGTSINLGGTLSVANGALRVAASGTNTTKVASLTIAGDSAPTATLDLNNNSLVVTTPTAANIAQLKAGYAGGAWNGTGISSSAANQEFLATNGTRQARYALGYALASDLGVTSFAGVTGLTGPELLVKYTYYGDLNLDGKVNSDDYALMDRSYAKQLPASWINGDLNYDGVVDAKDYLIMDATYAQAGGTLSPDFLAQRQAEFGSAYVAALTAAVPEPASLGLLGVAAVGLLGRRNRRQK